MKKLLLLFLCTISYNTAWTSAKPSHPTCAQGKFYPERSKGAETAGTSARSSAVTEEPRTLLIRTTLNLQNNELACELFYTGKYQDYVELIAIEDARKSLAELRKKHTEKELLILRPWWLFFNDRSTELKTLSKE